VCRRGIHFLLDLLLRLPNSTNVSLSCGRVARYIFGELQAVAQMAIDDHPDMGAVERVGDGDGANPIPNIRLSGARCVS
jgi:hypothetical protein